VDAAAMRHRLAEARVATLGTVDGDGRPHLVPVCFAWTCDDRLVTAVDHKPKRTTALARLAQVRAHPAVSVLVDEYRDDWDALWWVRVDGTATVLDDVTTEPDLLGPLVAKYPPYAEVPPAGAAIVVTVQRWQGWSAR
jgi:PPOX class probable F420-dependent enzyme